MSYQVCRMTVLFAFGDMGKSHALVSRSLQKEKEVLQGRLNPIIVEKGCLLHELIELRKLVKKVGDEVQMYVCICLLDDKVNKLDFEIREKDLSQTSIPKRLLDT